jgi:hypothetical protein
LIVGRVPPFAGAVVAGAMVVCAPEEGVLPWVGTVVAADPGVVVTGEGAEPHGASMVPAHWPFSRFSMKRYSLSSMDSDHLDFTATQSDRYVQWTSVLRGIH